MQIILRATTNHQHATATAVIVAVAVITVSYTTSTIIKYLLFEWLPLTALLISYNDINNK